MKKTILTIIAVVFMASAQVSTAPSAGTGDSLDPYQISTVENFYWLSQEKSVWDKCFVLISDIDASSSNEWDNDSGFSPIGDTANIAFSGRFNGHGHQISNLTIKRDSTAYVGLFGYTSGIIDSLILTDCNIYGKGYVGGIAGTSLGQISGCKVTGKVAGSNSFVGGIAGSIDSGNISGCISKCEICGQNYLGGIVGSNIKSSIYGCSFSGKITGQGYIAGIAGKNSYSAIKKCNSSGYISGSGVNVGGLVGYNIYSDVGNSYSTCDVYGEKQYVGGIIAQNYNGTIKNCYETGSVYGAAWNVGSVIGANFLGTVENCYGTGSIYGDSSSGGVVGCNSGYVNFCYASGRNYVTPNKCGIVGINDCYVSYCRWDKNTTQQIFIFGDNSAHITSGVGLYTYQMKQDSNFTNWDFDYVWKIRRDSTYPGLDSVDDNAPFAFADSLEISSDTLSLSTLLSNDFDIETCSKNLVLRLKRSSAGSASDSTNYVILASSIDTIEYRVGEVRADKEDTLWGNVAVAVIKNSKARVDLCKKTGLEKFSVEVIGSGGRIRFFMPVAGMTQFYMYSMSGQILRMLPYRQLSAGLHVADFSCTSLPTGTYMVSVVTDRYTGSALMHIVK